MSRFAALTVFCVACLLGTASLAWSDEAPSAADIKTLVLKLSDPDAAVRDATEKQLIAVGLPVIEDVSSTADSPNLEVVARCVGVLAALRNSTDKPTREAAEAALKKLSESKNRSLARRANAVINPNVAQNNLLPGVAGGAVQMNVVVNNARISVTNRNGDRTLSADDESGKTEISRKASGEVAVKLTKTDDKGKPQTTTADAKNVEELKKQHPEAFKVYQKYETMLNGNRLNLQVRGGAMAVGLAGQPIPVRVQVMTEADKDLLKKDLETSLESLRQAAGKLKDLAAKGPVKPEDLQQVIAEIETVNQRLLESRKKLER